MNCPIHGEYRPFIYNVGPREIVVNACPKCFDLISDSENLSAKGITAIENQSMNIEPEFYGATFETFQATTPELKKNLEAVKRLVYDDVKKIVMLGRNGTGKTHLAIAALHATGEGRIVTVYEIGIMIRDTYTPGATRSELSIVDELAHLPLLVIDEIGRTKGGESEEKWLSYIIDKRHSRGLPIILISNKHDRKSCPENGCPNCIENYITEDVMSRLTQDGVMLRFTGEDFRKRRS